MYIYIYILLLLLIIMIMNDNHDNDDNDTSNATQGAHHLPGQPRLRCLRLHILLYYILIHTIHNTIH